MDETSGPPQFPPYVPEDASSSESASPPTRSHGLATPYPQHEDLTLSRIFNAAGGYDTTRSGEAGTSSVRRKPKKSPSKLLAITAERLNQKTVLAHKLQEESQELLTLLRNTHRKNQDVQTELSRAKEELRLYKLQYDMAQKEIERADIIVRGVEQARIEAEERSARDREKTRKLIAERETERAREEGKKEGFKEGLEQGRRMIWAENERVGRSRETQRIEQPVQSIAQSSGSSSKVATSPERSRTRSRKQSSVAAEPIPVPPPAVPIPVPQPSSSRPRRPSLSHAPPIQPKSYPEQIATIPHPRQRTFSAATTASRPQYVLRPTSPTKSIAPSVNSVATSRRHVPPPDNYIPFIANGSIRLPPPHELHSQPLSPRPESPAGQTTSFGTTNTTATATSIRPERRHQPPPSVHHEPSHYRGRAPSRASTRISEYDLLKSSQLYHATHGVNNTPSAHANPPKMSPTQKIAHQWRLSQSQQSDQSQPTVPLPTRRAVSPPSSVGRANRGRPTSSRGSTVYVVANPDVKDDIRTRPRSRTTTSATPVTTQHQPGAGLRSVSPESHRSTRSKTPIVGPRRPREIVMPVPLDPLVFAPPASRVVEPKFQRSETPFIPPLPRSPSPNTAPKYPTQPQTIHGDQLQVPGMESTSAPNNKAGALAWLRSRLVRSNSSPGDVNIQVESPSRSQSPSSTPRTVVDPVLLTPDNAMSEQSLSPSLAGTDAFSNEAAKKNEEDPVFIVLPDNHLPPGFVPQSPMYAMHVQHSRQQPSFAPFMMGPAAGPSTASAYGRGFFGSGHTPSVATSGGGPPAGFDSPSRLDRPISLFSDD